MLGVASLCSISVVLLVWCGLVVFWIGNLKKKGKCIVLYNNDLYLKCSCMCINLSYMLLVFGLGNLKIIILYVNYFIV